MLAIIAGLTSFYVHALVDFVFYVPFLLLMIACSLGLFNQIVDKYYQCAYIINLPFKFISFNLLKSLTGLIVICLLSQPAIAQLAYNVAIKRTINLDIKGAMTYFELARRFAPYEPNYYWYEGAVLMNAVKLNQHQLSAIRADKLFAKGMMASPYDVKTRLARAELHRDYAYLLDNPAELNVILSWNEEALYWRPNDPVIQTEYLKTLIALGKYNMANDLLKDYLLLNPDSENLHEIKELLKING
jgi:hypothetical protein